MHGGTAIWRCYGGNRFSEDVDVYLPRPAGVAVNRLVEGLFRKGLARKKFKQTENAIYAKFSYVGFPLSLEALFRSVRSSVVKPFEMADGTFIMVNVLSPEALLLEKISAFEARRKVRDLYDMFFLINLAAREAEVVAELGRMLKVFRAPEDPGMLRTLVITGSIPTVGGMVEEIGRWAR